MSDLLTIGNLAGVQQATGVESAALFIYTLPRPLDLRAHGSALVPFVQAPVSAKRITWVGADTSDEPRVGVLFTNNTKQTLPPGPIAFFSDGGFSGESALDRLKPNEKRYLQYGVDIDVEASREYEPSRRETQRLEFKNSNLYQHYVQYETVKYVIENRSGQPREVHWVLSVVANAKVEGADEVRFDDTENQGIAIFRVPARKKVERTLHIEQGLWSSRPIGDLSVSFLEEIASMESLSAEHRKTAAEAAEKQRRIEEADQQLKEIQADIERIGKDLERFREHLKALGGEKGAGIAANPFVKRILDAEDKLELEREKERKLLSERDERRKAVRTVLEKLAPPKGD